jgi:co-chaperonin GroES (HSP10)
MENMRPLRAQVLIRMEEADAGNDLIEIPGQARKSGQFGRAEAVGRLVSEISVGDRVLLDVSLNSVSPGSLVLVAEKEILAVVNG